MNSYLIITCVLLVVSWIAFIVSIWKDKGKYAWISVCILIFTMIMEMKGLNFI